MSDNVVQNSFFSVSYDLIVTGLPMLYDLYVNASGLEGKDKYVRAFPEGETMTIDDIFALKSKYPQLYVPESQRPAYVKSLSRSDLMDDTEKTEIIKDSAIKYLNKIFHSGKSFSTELLSETIENCREAVESMVDVLNGHDIGSLHELIGGLSFHDFYTYDHSINVSMYSIAILQSIKPDVERQELVHAGLGGLLHDLGKIKIPTHILNNPGRLSEEEFLEIKKHPDFGLGLLMNGHVTVAGDIDLEVISRIVHEHHENWDGTGYPNKLADLDIHFLARICCVADFFDAITTKRSYNEVLEIDNAIGVMEKTVGKKIDPDIFDCFKKHVKKIVMSKKVDYRIADHFDPAIPYEKLPLEKEIIEEKKDNNFGKIKVVGDAKPKGSKKAKKKAA